MKWLIIILPVLFISCGPNKLAEAKINVEDGWHDGEQLSINFNSTDSSQVYDLVLDVKHSTEYAFQNLYIKVTNDLPDGSGNERIVSLELADKKGKWEGKCSGKKCTAEIPLQERFYFPQVGDYTITVEPYMRTEVVEQLISVQLSVVENESLR